MLLFHHKYLKAYKENNSFHFFFVVNTYRQGCKHDRMGKMEKTGGLVDQRKADCDQNIDAAGDKGVYKKLIDHSFSNNH